VQKIYLKQNKMVKICCRLFALHTAVL